MMRHLKQYHKCATRDAMNIICSARPPDSSRPYKKCPQCGVSVQRLDQHIKQVHEDDKPSDVTKPTTITNVESEVVHFKAWLQSIDGGKLQETTASSYASQVKKLLVVLGNDMKHLANYKCLVVQDGFLDQMCNTMKPTTIKSYMFAMRRFFAFQHGRKLIPDADCDTAEREFTRWTQSLRNMVAVQHHNYAETEQQLVPKVASAMAAYDSTNHRRAAIRLLYMFGNDHHATPSGTQFTQTRDYLVLELLRQNGQRSGAILNATLDEFETIRKFDEDSYILKVKKHKTAATYGSARLCMSSDLYTELDTWVTVVRSKYLKCLDKKVYNSTVLFCNKTTGKRLSASRITQIITGVLGSETALPLDLGGMSITATRMRKAHYLIQRDEGASESHLANVSSHLTHRFETAKKFYDVSDADKNSNRVSKSLRAALTRKCQQVKKTTCIIFGKNNNIIFVHLAQFLRSQNDHVFNVLCFRMVTR